MNKVSELVKFLKDPHSEKVQQYKGRFQELDELSRVAVEVGDAVAYKSVEVEMKEVFFDYLTAIVVDSIYKLVPHVLIIWVISMKWPIITIPFTNWQVSMFGAYLLTYFLYQIGKIVKKPIKARINKFGILGFNRATEVTKS
ncbi:MAG TPA: hypothetical protein VFC84_04665 [Desulfosporosinus sp.]|nr:hypothetical protein [Desulfosporosinus sp.]